MQDTLHDSTAYMIHGLVTVTQFFTAKFKAVSYALDLVCTRCHAYHHNYEMGCIARHIEASLNEPHANHLLILAGLLVLHIQRPYHNHILLQVMETFAHVIMSTVCCRKLEYLYWSIVYVHM